MEGGLTLTVDWSHLFGNWPEQIIDYFTRWPPLHQLPLFSFEYVHISYSDPQDSLTLWSLLVVTLSEVWGQIRQPEEKTWTNGASAIWFCVLKQNFQQNFQVGPNTSHKVVRQMSVGRVFNFKIKTSSDISLRHFQPLCYTSSCLW